MTKPSPIQIATAEHDRALSNLVELDQKIADAETALEEAQDASKNAIRGIADLDEATRRKADTTARSAVLVDVVAEHHHFHQL